MEKVERFFEFEIENGLFDLVDEYGLRPWEAVRSYVIANILYEPASSRLERADDKIIFSIRHKLLKFFKFVLYFIKHRNSEVFFFLCSRDKRDGLVYDKICDDLYNYSNPNLTFTIESLDSYAFPNYKYGKEVAPNIVNLFVQRVKIRFNINQLYDIVKKAYPSANITVPKMEQCYKEFLGSYKYYKLFFSLIHIKKVFFVQNCIQKGLLAAANEMGVKIFEIQHGQISFNHPGYSYPESAIILENKIYHPNYLLTFGSFWSQNRFYPGVKDIVLGNNSYAENIETNDTHGNRKLLVIANRKEGWLLAQHVEEVLTCNPAFFFYFKLHPQQYHEYDKYLKRFEGNSHVQVISNQKTINELLNLCEGIFLNESTVELEALRMGRKVFVIKEQDYEAMDFVLNEPGVYACNSVDEFLKVYEQHKSEKLHPRNDLFEPFNEELAKQLLTI